MEEKKNNEGGNKGKQQVTQIEKWLRKHKLEYTAATKHPFIYSIHDGSIHFSSYKKWLVIILCIYYYYYFDKFNY